MPKLKRGNLTGQGAFAQLGHRDRERIQAGMLDKRLAVAQALKRAAAANAQRMHQFLHFVHQQRVIPAGTVPLEQAELWNLLQAEERRLRATSSGPWHSEIASDRPPPSASPRLAPAWNLSGCATPWRSKRCRRPPRMLADRRADQDLLVARQRAQWADIADVKEQDIISVARELHRRVAHGELVDRVLAGVTRHGRVAELFAEAHKT